MILDSQPSDEKDEDEKDLRDEGRPMTVEKTNTYEYGSSIAMSEHTRFNKPQSGVQSVVSTNLNLDNFRFSQVEDGDA